MGTTVFRAFCFLLFFAVSVSAVHYVNSSEWNQYAKYRIPLECLNCKDGVPFPLNDSGNGLVFGENTTPKYIWSKWNANTTLYLYYNNSTDYIIVRNDTGAKWFCDVETEGSATTCDYNVSQLYTGSGFSTAIHFDAPTVTGTPSDQCGVWALTREGDPDRVEAQGGYGVYLDGNDGFSVATMNSLTVAGDLTYIVWGNWTSTTGAFIWTHETLGWRTDYWHIEATLKSAIQIASGGSANAVAYSDDNDFPNNLPIDRYTAVIDSGTSAKWYVNSTLLATDSSIPSHSGTDNPTGHIGNQGGSSYLTGTLSELWIANRQILEDEIANLTDKATKTLSAMEYLTELDYYTNRTLYAPTNMLEALSYNFQMNFTNISANTTGFTANLSWNGTQYAATKIIYSGEITNYTFTVNVTTPILAANSNITYFWEYAITGDYGNTTGETVPALLNVTRINITNCTAGDLTTVLNITSKNESSLALLSTNINVFFQVQSTAGLVNFSTVSNNKQVHSFCINTGGIPVTVNADIDYINNGSAVTRTREYYLCNVNITNSSPTYVTVYSLDTATGSNVAMSVINVTEPAEDVIIRVLRWYPSLGSWQTVTMAKTGYDGAAVVDLELYNPFYSFQLYKNCGYIQAIGKMQILDTTLSSFFIETTPLLYDYTAYLSYQCNNTTDTVYCTVVNEEGWDLTPCVYVYDVIANNSNYTYLNCSNCGSPSPSSIVTCGFGNLSNRVITYSLTVDIADNTITLGQWSLVGDFTNPIGAFGWVLFIVLSLGVAGLAIKHPNQAVIAYMFSYPIGFFLKLIPLNPVTIAGMVILGIIVIGEAD